MAVMDQSNRPQVRGGDFPHLLVYGPPGAGKKTRIMALLRELYGSGVERLKIEHQNFETPSKKKLEIVTIASNYHIEVARSSKKSKIGFYFTAANPTIAIYNTGAVKNYNATSSLMRF
jgi:DNA polymerase III delta prime subunit